MFRFAIAFIYAWDMNRISHQIPTRILPVLLLSFPCGIVHAGDEVAFEIISEGLANGVSDDGGVVVGVELGNHLLQP